MNHRAVLLCADKPSSRYLDYLYDLYWGYIVRISWVSGFDPNSEVLLAQIRACDADWLLLEDSVSEDLRGQIRTDLENTVPHKDWEFVNVYKPLHFGKQRRAMEEPVLS